MEKKVINRIAENAFTILAGMRVLMAITGGAVIQKACDLGLVKSLPVGERGGAIFLYCGASVWAIIAAMFIYLIV